MKEVRAMSTNAMIVLKLNGNNIKIFRHWDGNPEHVMPDLQKALALSWPLPRMEPDEFAAAIVATFKTGEGNIRIIPDANFSVEYTYTIHADENAGKWAVEIFNDNLGQVIFNGHIGDDFTE
jgi:hypothetical protein